jgi:HTH-type transcriptional regulator/antitoxin HigA
MTDETPHIRPMPGEAIRAELDRRGLNQETFARMMGRHRPECTNLISGKRSITPEIAIALSVVFEGTNPEYWLELETHRQLSLIPHDTAEIKKRVQLYQLAPIREMEKRGWIKPTKDAVELEAELKKFFGTSSLDTVPEFPLAMRKGDPLKELNPLQRAWCFRARQLASELPIGGFEESRMDALMRELRILAAYPAEARRVADLLREFGIRFVVVKHLSDSKIDGAAFWIDENSPAIAVSLRLDRVDNFWFTLMHECTHIRNRDAISIDTEMGVEERHQPMMKDEIERRADEGASAALIPPSELESFIRRMGPLYAKSNVIQFAHRMKIHPGIIVGQLQHRAELRFGAHREMLPKVREYVVSTALTDGWGVELSPESE